jgi:HD-like signal output (HDOD) protein
MIGEIRGGVGSCLDFLLSWWRPRVRAPRETADRFTPQADAGVDGTLHVVHTEAVMRRFTAFALDERLHDAGDDACDEEQRALLQPAIGVLERLELQAKYLPRRPSLLPKLMSAINSDTNSMRELAAIIGEDGALLGGLLRLANSSFYRVTDKPIESLERAVTMVGTEGIRSIIATALLHPVMTMRHGAFAAFPQAIWEHTQYSAAAAELHGAQVEHVDVFSARLVALLHGLASNAVFRIVREECLETAGTEVQSGALVRMLEDWVGPTAVRIAESWQLPLEHRTALAAHPSQNALARSLRFGRLAGAQIVLVKRGLIKEAAARATLLADEHRRVQIDRLWARLAALHLARA